MKQEQIDKIEEMLYEIIDKKITNEMMHGTKSMQMRMAIEEAIEEFVKKLEDI